MECRTPQAFSRWLARHHRDARGVWLKIAKRASGIRSVTHHEAVDVALCWGWIDGQARRIDEIWYVQKFTPRSARSVWSKINCARATALIAAGKMQPAGLAEVARARKDGRWSRAYDAPSRAAVPPDLAAALARNRHSAEFFRTLDARNRYAFLHRIQLAVKPETRAKRIEKFVGMLARGEKLYP